MDFEGRIKREVRQKHIVEMTKTYNCFDCFNYMFAFSYLQPPEKVGYTAFRFLKTEN